MTHPDLSIQDPRRPFEAASHTARMRWRQAMQVLARWWLDLHMDDRTRFLSQARCGADCERRLRAWDDEAPRRARQRLMW